MPPVDRSKIAQNGANAREFARVEQILAERRGGETTLEKSPFEKSRFSRKPSPGKNIFPDEKGREPLSFVSVVFGKTSERDSGEKIS